MVPFARSKTGPDKTRKTFQRVRPAKRDRDLKKTEAAMKAVLGGLAVLALAVGSASAQETKVAVGISGWTGFAPLTLAKEAGIFKKNGLDVTHQEDPAGEPPPRDRVGRHPMRRHHGRDLDRVERQRRRHQADLPARQVLRRRRHGGAQRHRRRSRTSRARRSRPPRPARALFHARLVPEEERPVGEGRDRRQHGAGPRRRRPSSPARTMPR